MQIEPNLLGAEKFYILNLLASFFKLCKTSHDFKKVTSRFGVNVILSTLNKLGSLYTYRSMRKDEHGCGIKQVREFTKHVVGVVYCIPFSRGKLYVSQTSGGKTRGCASMRTVCMAHLLDTWRCTVINAVLGGITILYRVTIFQ